MRSTFRPAVPSKAADTESLTIKALTGVGGVSAADWNRCAGSVNPFVRQEFLAALEDSGSASAESGWLPRHLICTDASDRLLGALPLYLKGHSWGEYVFDHGWARAWEQAGGSYYPKVQGSIPFTPATGPRLLIDPAADRPTVAAALIQGVEALTAQHGFSSAHITFLPEDDLPAFRAAGWLVREGVQYHWHNQGYRDFDDFLEALSSRKRKNIRKERARVADAGLTLEGLTGADLTPAVWDRFYDFYLDTVDKRWGSAYLHRSFFERLDGLRDQVLLVVARDGGGDTIAGALNFIGQDTLFGRNWGCLADYRMLHFEACYYQAIDFAIRQGLQRVEAGAQGQHKIARGYLPTRIYSVHHIPHEGFRTAVARFLDQETRAMAEEIEALMTESPYRHQG